jgi:hypothetical protein
MKPPFMVISAPEMADLTPDDLVISPAQNEAEVDALWDLHDGRNLGTMVVAVYRLDKDGSYVRDTRWGLLGHAKKTRPATDADVINLENEAPSMGFVRKDISDVRTMDLGTLLGPEMLEKIAPVMEKIRRGEVDVSSGKLMILELLRPIKNELESKGVLDEYLAWYLAFLATQR